MSIIPYNEPKHKDFSIVRDLSPGTLIPVHEFDRAILPGRILESIPDEGCTLADLEHILDDSFGSGYPSDVIREEAFALYDKIEIIPRGPESSNIILRHTSRSRSALRTLLITLDARKGDDPYTGRLYKVSPRYSWLVAGSAAWKLHPSKCGVLQKNEDGTLKIGACSHDSTHERHESRLWCYDPACPTCYGAYARRAGHDAVERLIGGYQAWKSAGVELGPIKQWVYSPEQERAVKMISTPEGYRALRREKDAFMDKYGIRAEYATFHPWRIHIWAKLAYQKAMDARRKIAKEKEARGEELTRKDKTIPIWKWIHEEDLEAPGKDAIFFSPHWHITGFGYVEEDSRKILIDTGVVLKLGPVSWKVTPDGSVIGRDRKTGTVKTLDDLERAVTYPFTHIGVMYDTEKMYDEDGEFTDKRSWTPVQATVPSGLISSQKLSKQVTFEDESVFCVKCGAPVVEYSLHKDEGEILGEEGLWVPDWDMALPTPIPWTETVRIVTFHIRGHDPPPDLPPGKGAAGDQHG